MNSEEDRARPLVILSPETLRCDSMRSKLIQDAKGGAHLTGVPLFSTIEPFDYYLDQCPQELKDLGMFSVLFHKWPQSSLLQDATASHLQVELEDMEEVEESGG